MIIDFLSGIISAIFNKEIIFKSNTGIKGIVRKISIMILLIFFIPISFILQEDMRNSLIYVLYIGYLILELESILENYKKMNIDISFFEKILRFLKRKSK